MLRLGLAWLHLLALGIGFGAIADRAIVLRVPPTAATLTRAFRSDTAWGVAALLWIATGLWRLFGQTEKATGYYLGNRAFWTKMSLLGLILLLEVWPMITLIRWRIAVARGRAPDGTGASVVARRIAAISAVQMVLVAGMVFAAVAMARGYGARG